MSENKCRIFVSHSSKDTKLIRLTELTFANREIEPYFAGTRMEGKNPVDKIIKAITESIGLFAIITPNAVNDTHTRDWIVFEIGVATAKGIAVFVWMDQKVDSDKSYPRLLENITDYGKFDSENDEECYRIVGSIRDTAFKLAGVPRQKDEPTREQLEDGLVAMEEAQKIAEEFIAKQRSFSSLTVESIEPKGRLWVVKGSISRSSQKSYSSEHFTVTTMGREVISWNLKPGLSVAVG
jgi:hypothetical protein